jgi:HEAT repeat protein
MSSILSPVCRGRPRPLLLALGLLVVVAWGPRGTAQPLAPDLVDDLERLLSPEDPEKAPTGYPRAPISSDSEERKKEYEKRLEAYKTRFQTHIAAIKKTSPGEMARALLLNRWPLDIVELENDPIIKLHRTAREELTAAFQDKVRDAFQSKDPVTRAGAAVLIGETAAAARKPGTANRFVRGQLRLFARKDEKTGAPGLVHLLYDPDPAVRQAAIAALGQVEPDPTGGGDALRALLDRARPAETRLAATQALANIVTTSAELARSIGSDPRDREYFRTASTVIVPVLNSALEDPNPDVSHAAVAALGTVARAMRLLVEVRPLDTGAPGIALTDPKEIEREKQMQAALLRERQEYKALLEAFGGRSPKSLVAALARRDATLRIQASHVLGDLAAIDAALKDAKPKVGAAPLDRGLWAQVSNMPGEARFQLAPPTAPLQEAIVFVAWQPRGVIDELIVGLGDKNPRVRLATLDALEALGTDAEPAIDALLTTLEDSELFVRWATLRVLGKLGQALHQANRPAHEGRVVPAVARHLRERDLDVATAAAVALTRYGDLARGAVPQLATAVDQGDARFRIAATRAVEALGTAAAPALPGVARNLEDRSDRVTTIPFGLSDEHVKARFTAAQVLGRFGPLARDQVPALRASLFDPEPEVRRAAAEALLRVQQGP